MAKITRITTQKRKKSRYNIFIEKGSKDEYAFSVDEDVLIKHMLRKGMDLDEATMRMLKAQDEVHKFYAMAINLLSYRIRSKKEITDYLKKKEAEMEQIEQVLTKLEQEGYINDREFANTFVRSRINTSSKGPMFLKKELMEKGVAKSIIDEAVQVYTPEKQREKVHKLVAKKLQSSSKKSFQQQLQAIQGTLIQKGFSGEVIQEVLQDAKEEYQNQDEEKEAVVHQGLKLVAKYERKAEGFELKQKVKAALYRKGFSFDYIEAFIEEHMD
ncbi:recombination regulator RecX [Salinibacillus xinjiangensis]|uniref:Regulatory protein RecX n=1 Tax=Salinibacillus xinjiangensis TaxID=1229268 RepID=A0A6G1X9E2_9BACI|nr:recombination regulator RecX [Salinibacillus xinjiangensis]MRG87525.1 recombination regulator RecX [Salinibacillus xinjiangensis]